jgi:acetolactate synthase I/II/III large subunit
VLQKAFQIALTEPRGPVYVCFPFQTFFEEADKTDTTGLTAVSAVSAAGSDNSRLSQAAEILLEAENPLIISGYSGRYPQTVDKLVELAETLCAPALTGQSWLNFPTTHPLCAGIEQILGSRKGNQCIQEADAALVIDYTMPYASAEGLPGKNTRIIHIDVDPSTQGRPLWDRGADIFIQADSREAIPALTRIINQKMTPEKRAEFNRRFKRLEREHNKIRSEWSETGVRDARQKPISPDWLCHCISRVIDEDMILVSHTISHQASITEQIPRSKPGTMLGCAAGSISWALGAALGAKLAAPDKTVISLMTDGGFVWGSPVATLWTASTYRASFLAVVFNNQSYGFIKNKIEENAGVGKMSDQMAFEAGTDLVPPPEYALIAQACGGYGRRLEDPADVLPALKEALKQVRSGKPAVLDVRLERA